MRAKVVDLSRVLAGPLCSMMLGDLGAHVIKVERSGDGDETRGWGPPFDATGMSAYFRSVNRNKKSIALDLTLDADRDVLMGLIAEADVVLDNFLPGSLLRLAIDADELVRKYPSLIWCTITGFGAQSARPGYDFLIQAEAGWMSITGETDAAPMKVGVALADVIAGKDAAIAILAALASRADGSAVERRIFIALLESARGALVNVAQNVVVTGGDAKRWGNAHPNLVPYQLFQASDRSFVIAVGSDAQWQACARALDLPAIGARADLRTNAGRVAQREFLVGTIVERVMQRPADYWIARLQNEGVPSGLVKTVSEALEGVEGVALSGMPPTVPGSVRLPPPALDEHGDSIRALGWRAFQR